MNRTRGDSIVFLSSRVGEQVGRTERRLFDTMVAAAELGQRVHFIGVPGGALVARAREAGFTTAVYRLDTGNIVRTRSRLRKYLKRYDVPLAHSTGVEADIILRLAARGQDVRVVNSLTRAGVPHHKPRSPFSILETTLQLRTLRLADALLVDSEDLRDDLLCVGVQSQRISLDPPTVDLARLAADPGEQLTGLPAGPLVGYAGRLERGRGIASLAAMPARLDALGVDARVVVAGEGPERRFAEGVAGVTAPGPVASVPAVLRALDVVCVPATAPGMPLPLLEALALERPVVASAVPGIAEFFNSGVELLLVPPGDDGALAAAVAAVLADPAAAAEMASRGRLRVVDEFSSAAGVERHLALYRALLAV